MYTYIYIFSWSVGPIYLRSTDEMFLIYMGFLSRTFTIHRTTWEEGDHLFNVSLLLPPALLMHRL